MKICYTDKTGFLKIYWDPPILYHGFKKGIQYYISTLYVVLTLTPRKRGCHVRQRMRCEGSADLGGL